ncbi:hypothetical protein D1646_21080, partial [Pseudoflavonifractor sp. 60]|uniref:hypothetical protein n=1 Tax=Pseudoflavonifractor sp. 60 TaxID=2304576 RepID=UPI00136B700A
MAQQFDSPQTEIQLREIQDKLYQHSEEAYDAGGRPAFKGLLEIMSAETTIVTAMSAPVIKCKKTLRKKCKFVAERRKKDRLPKGQKKRPERESGNERSTVDGYPKREAAR